MDIEKQLESSLKRELKRKQTVYSIAKKAGVKPELLYRFLRGEQTLQLTTAAKLATVLDLVLVPSSMAPSSLAATFEAASSEVLTMNDFMIGQTYSRQQISDILGGNTRLYLPTVNQRVVCGCFTVCPELNPGTPQRVAFGNGPIVVRNARILAQQLEPIPVFICQEYGAWEYVGRFRCTGLMNDPVGLNQEMAANPARGLIAGVLSLDRVSD